MREVVDAFRNQLGDDHNCNGADALSEMLLRQTVEGRIENLRPWKPGQSGNPGGRPKRDLATEIAQAIFERDAEVIDRVFTAELRKPS